MDGREVERRRKLLGLSAEQLGTLAGVSRSSVRVYERGDRDQDELTINRIRLAVEAAEAAQAELSAARGTAQVSRTDEDRLARLEAVVADLSSRLAVVLAKLDEPLAGAQQQPGGLQGLEPRPPRRRSVR